MKKISFVHLHGNRARVLQKAYPFGLHTGNWIVIIVLLLATSLGARAADLHRRCWAFCGHEAPVTSIQDATHYFLDHPARRIDLLAKTSSVLTTPVFKMTGIRGWKDYHLQAAACGEIVAVAKSWDQLRTVDMEIHRFGSPGKMEPVSRPAYIRFEVFPKTDHVAMPKPVLGDVFLIEGPLVWDGDGWMEIHPQPTSVFHKQAAHRCPGE